MIREKARSQLSSAIIHGARPLVNALKETVCCHSLMVTPTTCHSAEKHVRHHHVTLSPADETRGLAGLSPREVATLKLDFSLPSHLSFFVVVPEAFRPPQPNPISVQACVTAATARPLIVISRSEYSISNGSHCNTGDRRAGEAPIARPFPRPKICRLLSPNVADLLVIFAHLSPKAPGLSPKGR